jgi:capsular polysaccharide biosynthesis protein
VNEQPLSLRASFHEIWRRRLLVLVVAALCCSAGVVYGFVRPTHPTAVALVLLPPSAASATTGNSGTSGNSGAAGSDIDTDAVIAKSLPVLAAAGAKVSPPLGAAGVKDLVTVTPLSGQVLQIQAESPNSGYAVQVANAVAASYVSYIGQLQTSTVGADVTALQQEATLFRKQIKSLQTQINTVSARIAAEGAGSSAGEQDATLMGTLQSQQNQVTLQLNSVTSQIAAAQLPSGSTANTTRILQKAAALPVSKYALPIELGIIGLVIGALGTSAFLLIRLQRGRRLRLRDEIARAAGAPVIASLDAPRCTTTSAWRELLEGPPRATTEWALRHVLHSLQAPGGQRRRVRVISFAGDAAALTTGPRLALLAAASGIRTGLAPEDYLEPEHRSLAPLWASFTGAEPVGRDLPFAVGLKSTGEDPPQLLVSVMVFDGDAGMFAPSDTVNLLSISPNVVTADELAHLALLAADAGSALEGVVVVNPNPADTTSGLIADDTLRLLAPGSGADGGDDGLVLSGAPTGTAQGSPERIWSAER